MKRDIEKRCVPCGEMRAVENDDGQVVISGYAVVYNSESVLLEDLRHGRFTEVIRPGTFKRALESNQDIVSTANHDPKLILGRRSNGTLKLTEDEKGIFMEATPPNTTAGRDTIELVKGGYLDGMSFQFLNKRGTDKFTKQKDGTVLREVTDAELIELGPVTFPAYPQTTTAVSAEARSTAEALQREEEADEATEASVEETEASVEEEHKFDRVARLQKELDIAEGEI